MRLFLDALTPAGDYVLFQPGTPADTEDQIGGRPYGIGTLFSPVTGGAVQLQVACEHADYANLQPFRPGDVVRVADKPSTGGSGNEEWATLLGVAYGPDYATLDLAAPLVNGYGTANTLVSSVYEIASVAGAVSGVAVASSAGTFDSATAGNLIAHNKGAVQDTWTLTFTSATSFTASGLATGALAVGGSISADFSPVNPATGTPYCTVKSQAFGGTWAANDTLTFVTSPASIPLWYRRRVPTGTSSLANDFCSVALHGESA